MPPMTTNDSTDDANPRAVGEGAAEEPTGAEGAQPRPKREHFVERYHAAWKVVRVPVRYSVLLMRSILDPPPDEKRVVGPYCRSDHTLLKYKDYNGVRSLMDDDDLGGGGSLHCPNCENTFKPDEGYHGEATVEMYRNQLERELNR